MALVHIKSTGTKTSGASTPDQWDNSNCYPYTSIDTALNVAEGSSPAQMIFDDEELTLTEQITLNTYNPVGGTTLTLSSRSGGTVWRPANATTRILAKNADTTVAPSFEIENITFDGSNVTWSADDSVVLFSQDTAAVTLTGVKWKNFNFSGSSGNPPLFRFVPNAAKGTVTMSSCRVENVSLSSADNDGLFQTEAGGGFGHDWEIDGLTLSNVTMAASNGSSQGVFFHTSSGTLSISNLFVTTGRMSNTSSSNSLAGIVKGEGTTGEVTIDTFIVDDFEFSTSTSSSQGLFYINGVGTVKNGIVTNCNRRNNTTGNCVGLLAVSAAGNGDVLVQDCQVYNCHGFYGMGGYNTNGGTIVCERIQVFNVTDGYGVGDNGQDMEGLAFYSGGDGDTTWTSCLVKNVRGRSRYGKGVFAHHQDRTNDNAKTVTIRNCTFTDIEAFGEDATACEFKSGFTGGTVTYVIDNCLFDNGIYDIKFNETNGTLNATMRNCHVTSGGSAIFESVTTGTVTTNTPNSGDPQLDENNIPQNIDVYEGGLKWWSGLGPEDVDNEPFPNMYISIGAKQNKKSTFHPKVLFAA